MKKSTLLTACLMTAGLIMTSVAVRAQGTCLEELSNLNNSSTFNPLISLTGNGDLLGNDEITDSGDDYKIVRWAEPYDLGAESSKVHSITFLPWKGTGAISDSIKFMVYDDNAGVPGNILDSVKLSYNDVDLSGGPTTLDFETPVAVSGVFYVGYELDTITASNEFALEGDSLQSGDASEGFTLASYNDEWHNVNTISDYEGVNGHPLQLKFALTVNIEDEPIVASFDLINSQICRDASGYPSDGFSVDASNSTGNITSYEWIIKDGDGNIFSYNATGKTHTYYGISNAVPDKVYAYLVVEGGASCKNDTTGGYEINFYDEVDADIAQVEDATCGMNNGTVAISNESGGDGNYLYSLDGTNYVSGNYFTGLAPTNYFVYVKTQGVGCSNYIGYTTINSVLPDDMLTITGDNEICQGETAELTASGDGEIEWHEANGSGPSVGALISTDHTLTVTPSSSTSYWAKITDDNGCSTKELVTVVVNPIKDASFTYSSNTYCKNASNMTPTLVSSGGTFTVDNSDLEFVSTSTGEIDMTETSTGTYNITYTIGTGSCSSSKTQAIKFESNSNLDPTFTFEDTSYCQSEGVVVPTMGATGSAGQFYAEQGGSPSSGLAITQGTGEIDAGTSQSGTYQVINLIPATGSCLQKSDTFDITIFDTPPMSTVGSQDVCVGTELTLAVVTPNDSISWSDNIENGDKVIVEEDKTYTVTATSDDGCTNIKVINITALAQPNLNTGGDQVICNGGQVTLNATSTDDNVTFNWNLFVNNNVPFYPSINDTVYKITATSTNGCKALDSVKIIRSEVTDVYAGENKTTCSNANPITLYGAPNGGTFSGTGITGDVFDVEAAGEGMHTITYTYQNAEGCENSDVIYITVEGCAGVEKEDLNSFIIYPNPASNNVKVSVQGENNIENIQLLSIQGKVVNVTTNKIDNKTIELNVSSIDAGTYFIQLTSKVGQTVKKVVIQ